MIVPLFLRSLGRCGRLGLRSGVDGHADGSEPNRSMVVANAVVGFESGLRSFRGERTEAG